MRSTCMAWITLSVFPLLLSPQLASCESDIFKRFQLSASEGFRLKALSFSSLNDDVWKTYKRFENTFYRAPTLASLTTTPSDAECAKLCRDNGDCQLWSWCPQSISAGCEVLEFCSSSDNATTSSYEPGTCILSYDPNPGRVAFTYAQDDGVAWVAGFYDEQALSPPSARPSPPSPSPARLPPPSPSPARLSPPSPSSKSSPGATRSPSPGVRTPSPSPPSRLSPPSPASTVRIPAGADIILNMQLNLAGDAPQCYNIETDDLEAAPESYGPLNQPDSNPSSAVQDLADEICSSPTKAATSFVINVLYGGEAAEESVAALVHAYNKLECLGTRPQQGSALSSKDFLKQDPTLDATGILDVLLLFGQNLVAAGDAVGAGVCVAVYYIDGRDVTEITTLHTGSSED